jgi:hypothetical protein
MKMYMDALKQVASGELTPHDAIAKMPKLKRVGARARARTRCAGWWTTPRRTRIPR